jgi:hypothetical protein
VATVDVMGSAVLYPGKAINLAGAAIPNVNQAAWIVTAADHVGRLGRSTNAAADSYLTHLTIMTNQKTATIPHIKGIQQIVPEMVSCNLAGNIWHASTLNVVVEGIVN